jgi:hypothetical protein
MKKVWSKLPIRENYKEVPDSVVRLKAPPAVSKLCFIFELCVVAIAFAFSFYISFTNKVVITQITYEPLGSPYSCKILSPRSDSVEFSKPDNEVVEFSGSRFMHGECLNILGSNGMNVCADKHRDDSLTGISALLADDSNCFDILLIGGFRMCYSVELVYHLPSPAMPNFPVHSYPTVLPANYYFMNNSRSVVLYDAPFTLDDVISDYIPSVNRTHVYAVAQSSEDGEYYLYEFDTLERFGNGVEMLKVEQTLRPVERVRIDMVDMAFAGMAVEHRTVHMALLYDDTMFMHILSFSLDTNETVLHTVDCNNLVKFYDLDPPNRFLSVSPGTGKLYMMCGTPPKAIVNQPFTIFELDTTTFEEHVLHVNISALQVVHSQEWEDPHRVSSVRSLVSNPAGTFLYLATGDAESNLLEIDLSSLDTGSSSARRRRSRRLENSDHPDPTAIIPGTSRTGSAITGAVPAAETVAAAEAAAEVVAVPVAVAETVANHRASYSLTTTATTAASNQTMLPVANLGIIPGDYVIPGYGNTLYFPDSYHQLFNITSKLFDEQPSPPNYFYARHIGIGYSFQICNGKYSHYDIDPFDSATAFSNHCRNING